MAKAFFQKRWFKYLIFGLQVVLILSTLSLALYINYTQKNLLPYYKNTLQKKLETQVEAISAFLDKQTQTVEELSKDILILDFMQNAQKDERLENQIAIHLKTLQETIGFKSLSLIEPNGDIKYSTNPLMRGIKLNDETYSKTPLYLSFSVSSMVLAPDFSYFSFSSILKEAAFYVTAPLFYNRKVIGVIAFQIDEKNLNAITRDYLDLGKTGETVLAVQSGPQAFFITPTRNAPSIKLTKLDLFSDKNLSAIQRAARGEIGHGIIFDYLGEKTLASWSFIPRVTWGVVVKINLDEINAPLKKLQNYLLLSALVALFFLLILIIIYREYFQNKISKLMAQTSRLVPFKLRYFIIILVLFFSYLSVLAIYNLKHAMSIGLENSQHQAIESIKRGVQSIDAHLEKIRLLGDFIAQDLQTERLISQDIKQRMRREIVETDGLVRITIAYKPMGIGNNKKLYAPSIAQNDAGLIKEEMIGELYDYSDKRAGIARTQWYTLPLETKTSQWLNPSFDPISKKMVITYSTPFYFKNDLSSPAGVIAINFKLSQFAEIAQNIGIGPTGYSFIISEDGTFLYHPTRQNTLEKKNLLQFAQEEGSEDLEEIAKEVKSNKPIFRSFLNYATQSTSWIYTHPINITNWTIATVFSSDQVGLSYDNIKKHIFIIITYITIALLALCFFLANFYRKNILFNFINFSNLILLLSLLCFWYTIQATSVHENKKQVLVSDEASVNKFISRQIDEAKRKNEELPLIIPCGVELFALEQSSPTHLSLSGYIWHKYHKTLHKDVKRGIHINESISYTILNETLTTEGDWDIVGANITATIYQPHDYKTYPFDKYNFIVPLEHTDLSKNILLVPDLAAYTSIDSWKLPGLESNYAKGLVLAQETFYNYTSYKPSSDWGVRKFQSNNDQYRLAFNAIMKSDLLVPFIYFFLPLLVILISIFVILVLERRDTSPISLIAPYTGLLFSLVLLHRSLHEAAPATGTVYLEYAFLYTYIILILLIIHALLLQWHAKNNFYQSILVPFLKVIFWPLQLMAWIITTIVIFY